VIEAGGRQRKNFPLLFGEQSEPYKIKSGRLKADLRIHNA
jgi:hypothetical protein